MDEAEDSVDDVVGGGAEGAVTEDKPADIPVRTMELVAGLLAGLRLVGRTQ